MTVRGKEIAVVGGGVFGSTAAIMLAEAGYKVSLFEKNADIMQAASAINQYRLHRGYHYPRSTETIRSCKEATPLFESYYKDAVIKDCRNYYAIANNGSKVSFKKYIDILNEHDLPFVVERPTHINQESVEGVVGVKECLYDPFLLREIVRNRLTESGVDVCVNRSVNISELSTYSFIVVAAYASINEVLKEEVAVQRRYQFEVCEKIVIDIPESLRGVSTVVMDGPFMSFDPYGKTGYAVMGHVEHAIHAHNVGMYPEIPGHIRPLLNKGVVRDVSFTKARDFIDAGRVFIPDLGDATYVGSMFTIRTVLPYVDDTDTRPTIVNSVDGRIITIYSGKVGNSVKAGKDVLNFINGENHHS